MAGKREVDVWIWDVGSDLRALHVEMIASPVSAMSQRAWSPKVDVLETQEHLWVWVELAGVPLANVRLTYDPVQHRLELRGVREMPGLDSPRPGVHQLEILTGEFAREIRLPRVAIDESQIEARLSEGLLKIRIPKVGN